MKDEKQKEYFSLSHPQYRIWYTEQSLGENSVNNIGGLIFLSGNIDCQKIKETLNYLLLNNVALNLRFTEQDGEPKQYIFYDKFYKIEYSDLSKCNNPKNELYRITKQNMGIPFCLKDSSLYDFQLFKLSNDNYAILVKLHHLICDGWSISLIVKQINQIYSELINNENVCIDSYSYLNYLEKEEKYLNSNRFERDKKFWNDKYYDIPKEFQVIKNDTCSSSERVEFCLDEKETEIIRNFAKNKKISLNVLCIACMALYLSKTLDKEDITIGIPIYNRGGKTKKSIGMFTSTVPLKLNIKSDMRFIDYLYYVDNQVRESIFHSMYPYNLLIKDCRDNGYTCNHLYDVSVNYYNTQLSNSLCGVHATYEELHNGNLPIDLQLVINEWDEYNRITLIFDYRCNKYNIQKINRIYNVILNFLCSSECKLNTLISEMSLFSEEEKDKLLYQFNDTEKKYPKEKTIIDLIEEKAKEYPGKNILEKDGEFITYSELCQKVNSLMVYLRSKGIQKQDRVCLITSHSFETVIGILAILKLGATYIPIDENYPIQRIKAIIEDSEAKMVITNLKHIVSSGLDIQVLDLSNFIYLNKTTEIIHNEATPEDIAYIIYTSGSTGKPKGVMISHKALVNYIWWAKKQYVSSIDDAFALYSSLAFDLTVTSIFTPLISATKMIIYSSSEQEYVLYRIMRENKATIVKLTPSHLSLLTENDYSNSNVKVFIVGGEELKVSLAKKIQENFGMGLSIFNEYGPTETTVGCMIYKYDIEKDKDYAVPIGIPADNVKLYILDDNKNLVYYDCIGELYIAGDGVAEGYVNLEELTKERFIDNPFVKGQIMYKTGDLCRYGSNGVIEYIGRKDKQVKINGFRIELQEIEKNILQIPGINDALVKINTMNNNVSCLCAYLILEEEISEEEIKRALRKVLPEYMIPTQYVYMETFPITSNGKVDKDKLPIYEEKENLFKSPKTEKEKILVEIIKQVIEIEKVGVNQNFFNIGGDSIKAIQIVARLGELGYELKVKDILTNPIINDMAKLIENKDNKMQTNQKHEEGEIQFTPIIQWFFQEKNITNKDYWNQSVLLEIDSKISYEFVKTAIMKLINYHDVLRLSFNSDDNKIFYNNKYLDYEDAIQKTNISYNTETELKEKLNEVCESFKQTMNIEHSICFKALWIDIGQTNSLLLLTANHLVVDGISWRILLDDFKRLLLQQIKEEKLTLPNKTTSYKEWSKYLNDYISGYVPKRLDYWNECNNLLTSYDNCNEFHWSKIENSLSESNTKKFINNLDNNTLEQDEILMIALGLTLQDIYGTENKFVIEAEGHGREEIFENVDLTRTVGWFTIHYPILFNNLQNDIKSDIVTLKDEIRSSKKDAFEYMMLKYKNVLTDKGNRKIRFNYMGNMTNGLTNDLFTVSQYEHGREYSDTNGIGCSIEINNMILYNKLIIQINYNDLLISSTTAQRFIKTYTDKINEILDIVSQNKAWLVSQSDYQEVSLSKDEFDMLFE
ncbi:MAG: amino acid adenylation domain-containing protein [Clostridiales bacterium]|nr:amino acid adenylation domain-containing protein [Clostridiales bacterium]